MSKCPLLLKYKLRDCREGEQADIDVNNANECIGDWQPYGNPRHVSYRLHMPNSRKIMREDFDFPNPAGRQLDFTRYEIHAAGDPNPVLINFAPVYFSDNNIEIFQLPGNYRVREFESVWYDYFESHGLAVLQEYERCRDRWQTRIIIERD